MNRIGLGKNRGSGYYNIVPKDPYIHSLSAKGIKTKLYAKRTFGLKTEPPKSLDFIDEETGEVIPLFKAKKKNVCEWCSSEDGDESEKVVYDMGFHGGISLCQKHVEDEYNKYTKPFKFTAKELAELDLSEHRASDQKKPIKLKWNGTLFPNEEVAREEFYEYQVGAGGTGTFSSWLKRQQENDKLEVIENKILTGNKTSPEAERREKIMLSYINSLTPTSTLKEIISNIKGDSIDQSAMLGRLQEKRPNTFFALNKFAGLLDDIDYILSKKGYQKHGYSWHDISTLTSDWSGFSFYREDEKGKRQITIPTPLMIQAVDENWDTKKLLEHAKVKGTNFTPANTIDAKKIRKRDRDEETMGERLSREIQQQQKRWHKAKDEGEDVSNFEW